MLLDKSKYYPYCYNLIKDCDEDEIDCVYEDNGVCPVCNKVFATQASLKNFMIFLVFITLGGFSFLFILWYLFLWKSTRTRARKIRNMSELK